MDNVEKNAIIALALGFQKTDLGYFDNVGVLTNEKDNTFNATDLKFDTDWSWIMDGFKEVSDIMGTSINNAIGVVADYFGFDGIYTKEDFYEALYEFSAKELTPNVLRPFK